MKRSYVYYTEIKIVMSPGWGVCAPLLLKNNALIKLCSGPASPIHIFNVWTVDMQSHSV